MARTKDNGPAQVSEVEPDEIEMSKATPKTKLAKLNNAEKHWTWKAGLRVIISVLSIIAICALAWIRATQVQLPRSYAYGYGFGFRGLDMGALATFLVDLIWCTLAILVPFILKKTRPLHPGIAVGVDLVFWGGFLVIGMFALSAVFEVTSFASNGYIQDPNWSRDYSGSYRQAANGTWVYNITWTPASTGRYNSTSGRWEYPPLNLTGVVRSCTPAFDSCEAQDQFINNLARNKSRREGPIIMVDAIAWLNLALHFALFVWACVDCHRHNRRFTVSKEQAIANRVIADLEKRGVISLKNGVAHPVGTTNSN